MTKPLEGIRVLDLTQFLSGPQATLFLAGLGAEVIRIDNPATGDPVAYSPPYIGEKGVSYHPQTDEDLGIAYLKRTRAKKAITLNIKDPRGLEMFYGLVDQSDILVENFSVGVTKRLKVDYETLHARKPSLVYCSITGYGQTGPDAGLKGYDAVSQAASGLMNLTGFPDGPPTKAGSALGDSVGGTFAFGAIMAALFHRERTGKGQQVDISMIDCIFSLIFDEPMDCYEQLGLPPRIGNRIMRLAPFNAYETKDGWVIIASGTNAHWHNILRGVERADLIGDERYEDMSRRVSRVAEVDAIITEWTKRREAKEAVSSLRAHDVICGPVNTIEDILAWPHMRERGMIVDVEHPTLGTLKNAKAPGFPFKFSGMEGGYAAPAPLVGQHNAEILGGLLGVSDAELKELGDEGVV